MWHTVRRLGLKSLIKVAAIMYALMAVLYLPFLLLMALVPNQETGEPLGIGMALFIWVLFLLLFPVMGAVFVGIFGWVYNFIANRWGGIDLWLQPQAEQAPPAAEAVPPQPQQG